MGSLAWQADASCLGEEVELFFSRSTEEVERAKAFCARCPVREECLAHALESGEKIGVWGGLNGTERRHLRTAARPASGGAPLQTVTYRARNRTTGTLCEAGREADGRWGLRCREHGGRGVASSRTAAENAVARPRDWCVFCRDMG